MKSNFTRTTQVLLLIFIVALTMVMAACSSVPASTTTTISTSITTSTATNSTTTPAYTVNLMSKADLGNYLVDAKGMSLYYFTKDSIGKSTATGNVLVAWPIFNPASFVLPSSLNATDFGTITREDGQKQATYKGWPLYYYAKDQASGDTLGQGVNNVWFVINPEKFPPQPIPTSTATSTPTPTSTTTSASGPSVTIDLIAQSMAFDKSTITVKAGSNVTLNFNNQEGGIPHNFALYTNSSATTPIFVGQTITGPATITYNFSAPAAEGTYFFRCDIHPASMIGNFIVTP
jgi:predicted lipoprotein with Yx(FWY)xxD motif/plastocyanin